MSLTELVLAFSALFVAWDGIRRFADRPTREMETDLEDHEHELEVMGESIKALEAAVQGHANTLTNLALTKGIKPPPPPRISR